MATSPGGKEVCSNAGCYNPLPPPPESPVDSNARDIYDQLPPLNQQKKEIRLLRLLPDRFDTPIRCELFTTPLFESPSRNYARQGNAQTPFAWRTLSHVWGTHPGRKSITVNDQEIQVSVSLWECLFWLRIHGYVDPIWVDAICIDQQNLAERSSQVQMMSTIYKLAMETIVYQTSTRDSVVIDALTEHRVDFASSFEDISVLEEQMWAWYEGAENPTLQAASHVMDNRPVGSYWTRLWTVQEFVHAKSLLFIAGPVLISPRALANIQQVSVKAIARIINSLHLGEEAKGAERALSLLNGRISRRIDLRENARDRNLLEALTSGRNMACTDPRDCVYSTLSFTAISTGPNPMPVDYTLCTSCVWSSVTRLIIQDTGRLDFLGYCLLEHNSPNRSSTWTPNWRALPVSIEDYRNYKFSPSTQPTYKLHENPNKLEAIGVSFGSIKEAIILSSFDEDRDYFTPNGLLDLCMDVIETMAKYIDDKSKVEACFDDLAVLVHEVCLRTFQDYQDLQSFFSACMNLDRKAALEKIQSVVHDLRTFFWSANQQILTLLRTEADTFLLAVTFHNVPQNEALICGIWGCNFPLLVSRDADGDRIMSPCLVSGLGSGEASSWLQQGRCSSDTFQFV